MGTYLKRALNKIELSEFEGSIRDMALKSLSYLPKYSHPWKEANFRRRKPLDYLRCAEFPIALRQLELKELMKILDVGSPQWFSLFLAKRFPKIEFFYINILENEISCFQEIAEKLGIDNIRYLREDVREMSFSSSFFDGIVSISVLEHVAPEKEGDLLALKEMRRVLKPSGKITFSVPVKEEPRIIYLREPVYERENKGKNFFAREYSYEELKELIGTAGFDLKKAEFIVEERGLFSLDHWTWGRGRASFLRFPVMGFLKLMGKMGLYFENKFAIRYLHLSEIPLEGTICAVLTMEKLKEK